jgi:hypothetical protein
MILFLSKSANHEATVDAPISVCYSISHQPEEDKMAAVTPRFRTPVDPPLAAAPAPVPVAADRDYLSEVRDEVNDYLDEHDAVISAQAADELISRWEISDPDLLVGWLRARGRQVLRDYVYSVTLSRGARRPREEQRARFAKFAAGMENALEEGADQGREFYRYHSVTEGPLLVRKPLGDLTAKQVEQVRDRYRQAAQDNTFYARIYEAVRKRVAAQGDGTVVGDLYTPEQLEKMFVRQADSTTGGRK